MLDLKASAAAEVTAGVSVFQRGGLWGPKVLARHRLLMTALDALCGRQSGITLCPKRIAVITPPCVRADILERSAAVKQKITEDGNALGLTH